MVARQHQQAAAEASRPATGRYSSTILLAPSLCLRKANPPMRSPETACMSTAMCLERRRLRAASPQATVLTGRNWSGVCGQPGSSLGEHDEGVEEFVAVFGGGG